MALSAGLVFTGQADGLQCRTIETLHSLGLGKRIVDGGHQHADKLACVPAKQDGLMYNSLSQRQTI